MEELQEALHKQELSRRSHHALTLAGLEVSRRPTRCTPIAISDCTCLLPNEIDVPETCTQLAHLEGVKRSRPGSGRSTPGSGFLTPRSRGESDDEVVDATKGNASGGNDVPHATSVESDGTLEIRIASVAEDGSAV